MLNTVHDHYEVEELFADLLEKAYLEALIDGDQQTLAHLWLITNCPFLLN